MSNLTLTRRTLELNWLRESDEATFLITSNSPSMTQPLPVDLLCQRHNDHGAWEAPKCQACRDGDQCLLTSQSPIVKVWLTQANIGSDRLQNTIITYLSTINPQHGELNRNNCCRSVALDYSNIQRPVFLIREFCTGVNGVVLSAESVVT